MKITIELKDGKLSAYGYDDAEALGQFGDGIYEIDIKNMDIRTIQQNKAIHKYYNMLASALNDAGLTITKVLKIDTPWSMDSVKSEIWRPMQKAVTGKTSTTKLTRSEVSNIYDHLHAHFSSKYGVDVQFPSKDSNSSAMNGND